MKTLTLLLVKLLVFASYSSAQPGKPQYDPRTMPVPTSKSTQNVDIRNWFESTRQSKGLRGAVSVGHARYETIRDGVSWYDATGTVQKTASITNGGNTWIDLSKTPYMIPVSKSAGNDPALMGIIEHLVDQYSSQLGTSGLKGQLRLDTLLTDKIGSTHWKMNQSVDGRNVFGSQIFVHANHMGQVYAIQGAAKHHNPTQRWESAYSDQTVVDHVIEDYRKQGIYEEISPVFRKWLSRPDPVVQQIWYPNKSGIMVPAYEIELHPNGSEWYHIFVDAGTGEVLNQFSKLCSDSHNPVAKKSNFAPKSAPGASDPSNVNFFGGTFHSVNAVDLQGKSVPLRTFMDPKDPLGPYFMLWDTPSLDVIKSEQEQKILGGILTITNNNQDWETPDALQVVASTNNTWSDRQAVSAHNNMHTTYRYFLDKFNRNSYDDKGGTIRVVVHVTFNGQAMINAFWFNGVMGFGSGGVTPIPGILDVAGHEFTHAVVEYTAGLVYQFQSGSLNESYSDLFGNLVQNDMSMLVGEGLYNPAERESMRNMLNPASTKLPPQNRQPAHMSDFLHLPASENNGGVHRNSGIPNRAAALIATTIGFDKTAEIYYRALMHYLTRNSQFIDSRRALIQSATDLFGPNSHEVSVIMQAHDTVGIVETDGSNPDPKPETPPPVPPITGEKSFVAFMDDDGKLGLVDMTNPLNVTAGYINHPAAVARVSQQGSDRAQLTAPVNGQNLYFVNTSNRLAYVDLNDMQVYEFQNLFIHTPGDIWNVSINPQGNMAALVSAYTNDATLYFTDGSSVVNVPIMPETTGQGIKLSTVLYPDVVSWSPDPAKPRLVFDALNRISMKNGDYDFWSVFEMDFNAGTIFNMIPGQPVDISIGNITYSKLHPNILAFNTMQNNTGVMDIVLVNFNRNTQTNFNLPTSSIGGTPLTDGSRPSFSPDNKYLTFSSAQFGALFFIHLESNTTTPIGLGIPIYNPHWFMFGGQYSTSDTGDQSSLPSDFKLHDAYPNPFNPATTVAFDLPQAGNVRYDLYDITGRRVKSVLDQPMHSGKHHIRLDAADLASGVYIGRLVSNGQVRSHKITLIK
jgi:bacillolysin